MSLSFTFRQNATKVNNLVDLSSCCLIFKLRLLSQNFCMLAWPQFSRFGYTNAKKAWVHSLSLNFHKFFVVSYSYEDSVAEHSKFFLLFEELFDEKILLVNHAVPQNYVFLVFQSEATEKNSHD